MPEFEPVGEPRAAHGDRLQNLDFLRSLEELGPVKKVGNVKRNAQATE